MLHLKTLVLEVPLETYMHTFLSNAESYIRNYNREMAARWHFLHQAV
jgi:hypothetical protein